MENRLTNIMKKFSIDYSFIISDKTEDLKSDNIQQLTINDRLKYDDASYIALKNVIQNKKEYVLLAGYKKNISIINRLMWECDNVITVVYLDMDNPYEVEEKTNMKDKLLWDVQAYRNSDKAAMSGWFNSYNYQQFSNEEIEEYIDNTVRKLSCYMNTNSRVLEVGVGSGMFVERMAELCARYDGCDISSVVLDKLQEELDSKNIGNVNLYNCSADEIDKLESEYDIIFMNSVTEYFSGYNYLRKVVEKCIEKIDKKGVIMFADVFDLAKKESYCNDIIRYSHGHPD